jgi:hypothetical protein
MLDHKDKQEQREIKGIRDLPVILVSLVPQDQLVKQEPLEQQGPLELQE